MYCKHCGKQIDNDSRFCPECGAEQFTTSGQETVTSELVDDEIAKSIDAKLRASAILFVFASVFSIFDFYFAISVMKELIISASEYSKDPLNIFTIGMTIIMLAIPILCIASVPLLFKENYKLAIPVLIILTAVSILMLIISSFVMFQLSTYSYLELSAVLRVCAYLLIHFFILLISLPSIFLMVYRSNFRIARNKWTAFVLCLFFGAFGFHRFYSGKISSGIAYLVTGGCLGIGVLVDLISILIDTFKDAQGRALKG